MKLSDIKRKIFTEKIPQNGFEYPKILHLYWDGSPLSYLNYITVLSFNEYHKGWNIIVYIPKIKSEHISWKTREQKLKYEGTDHFEKLKEITNLKVEYIDLNEIGFRNDASEVIKSDYFRYYILYKYGGVWSDFDIIYTSSIEDKMNFKEDVVIFRCTHNNYTYYPIGFFMAKPSNIFFKYLMEECIKNYNPDEYQSIGASMFIKLFGSDFSLFQKKLGTVKICNHEYYLPWAWNELDEFLKKKDNILPLNNVGIHWFNGAEKTKQYAIDLDTRLNDFKESCFLDKFVNKYISQKKEKKISIVMAYYNRKEQLIATLNRFQQLYGNKYNLEVIIVDDNSNDENDLNINTYSCYSFKIKYIKLFNKTWINPVIPYNVGINNISEDTDYIVFQNPEIFHCYDIFSHFINNIKENEYFTYPVFASPSFFHNNLIFKVNNDSYLEDFINKIDYKVFDFDYLYYINKYDDVKKLNEKDAENHFLNVGIKENRQCNSMNIYYRKNIIYETKGWYNHYKYNKRNLHFLSVMTKETLKKIGGFCPDMKDGLWYDDNDFVSRISKVSNVRTIESDKYMGIHQYHLSGSEENHLHNSFDLLRRKNLEIFNNNKNGNIIYCNPSIKVDKLFISNDEFPRENYKIGFCFKIYINDKTHSKRYEIIEDFIKSMDLIINHYDNLFIIGVIDCKVNDKLNEIISKINHSNLHILLLNENRGISFATNIGIEYLLNKDCDYIFSSDDDIVIKDKNIFNFYIEHLIKNKISHLGYYPLTERSELNMANPVISSYKINLNKIHYGYSGCFYCFTRNTIFKYGYLPIYNGKYGHEHVLFTKIITSEHIDIKGSNKYLCLNKSSFNCTSGQDDINSDDELKLTPFINSKYWITKSDKWNYYKKDKYTIYAGIHNEKLYENVIKNFKNIKNVKLMLGENIKSFSQLVNNCIKNCKSDIMIFCSHRVSPSDDDVFRLISKMDQGYGYVGLYRFAFFGIHKDVIKKIGYFDENFIAGYEDDDFRLRLNYADIGFYEDHSVEYRPGKTTWVNDRNIESKYFHEKYTINENDKTIQPNVSLKNENSGDTLSFLTYKDSIYVKDINSYYGKLGVGIHDFKFIKYKMKTFNLYHILSKKDNNIIYNVGDIYPKYLIEKLINNKVIQSYHEPDNVFQIIGSIIRDSINNSIILGTGILNQNDIIKCFKECHMVRGKITLDVLKKSFPKYNFDDIILGDPGLTISFFAEKKPEKIYDFGIILHYIDYYLLDEYFTKECLENVKIINVDNNNIDNFMSEILSCKKIISSSLHGIIFSHSLGIEAYWIRLEKTLLPIDDIKFYDYLSIYDIKENLCNYISRKHDYQDLNNLKPILVSQYIIDVKKAEIFNKILSVLNKHGYDIKNEYQNIFHDNKIGLKILCENISISDKFYINRIGGIEFEAYSDYTVNGFNKKSTFYQNMLKFCGYYDLNEDENIFISYMKEYKESLESSTVIMVANSKIESKMKYLTLTNPYFVNNVQMPNIDNTLLSLKHIKKISYHILESFLYFDTYFPLFENKKMLIISPFEEEIKSQLLKKDKLFSNFKYPNFKKIEYLNTYLTTYNFTTPHTNWEETFSYYKEQIKDKDFEICLLICGAYAYPLGNYIYNTLNKSCLHVGGIGQLFFGIKGGRYNIPYFTKIMNEHWIYPNQIIEKNANGVPNGDGLLGYFERI